MYNKTIPPKKYRFVIQYEAGGFLSRSAEQTVQLLHGLFVGERQNILWRVIRKLGNDDVLLLKVRVSETLEGMRLSELSVEGKMNPVALERKGQSLLPEADTCCEYHDMLYLAVRRDYLVQARERLQL